MEVFRTPLGHIEYAKYIDYTIWLVKRDLHRGLKIIEGTTLYYVEFPNLEDMTAFKLSFQL